VDETSTRHLLVRVPEAMTLDAVTSRTRALDVRVDVLSVSGLPQERYVVLACRDPAFYSMFDTLISDVATAVRARPTDAGEATLMVVDRWRRFWAVDPAAMSEEKALGLLGELWFLVRWMGGLSRTTVLGWQGPLGGNHDFQWPDISIEVKATANRHLPVRHRISGLEQLEPPSQGQLFLFSMQLLEDTLAANSLPSLVQAARAAVQRDAGLLDLFDEKLSAAGYTPAADTRLSRTYRVLSEELYHVTEGFPRLTRATFPTGVPAGVGCITYELSMDSCVSFRVAADPASAAELLRRR